MTLIYEPAEADSIRKAITSKKEAENRRRRLARNAIEAIAEDRELRAQLTDPIQELKHASNV